MTAKFIIFSVLVASVYGSGGYSSFSYGVSDPNTGDFKDQHEKRIGDSVVGKYSLLESDGTKRIVEYEANAATGFNAIVRKEPAAGVHASGHLGAQGPLGHGLLGHSAHGQYGPAGPHSAPIVPGAVHAAPLAPAPHQAPIVPSGPVAHSAGMAHSATLPHSGPLSHPGALPHSSPLSHIRAHPSAIGSLNPAGGLPHSGAFNPHANPHFNGGYAAANGRNNLNGHQPVPALSHFSHSIVHEIPQSYSYGGAFNGGYGGAYGGNGAYGRRGDVAGPWSNGFGASFGNGLQGAYGLAGAHGPSGINGLAGTGGFPAVGLTGAHNLAGSHGLVGAYGYSGIQGHPGANGVAQSYSSLTRGEAYPHGYGGFGARGHGAGYEAELASKLAW